MTAGAEPLADLEDIIRAGRALYPDLDFIAQNGLLDLRLGHTGVRRLRVEGPPEQFLHLQSIGVDTTKGAIGKRDAKVTTSSWHKNFGDAFNSVRLLDVEHPSGTSVHTGQDSPGWVELTFKKPVDLQRVRLRNVSATTARRIRGFRVLVEGPDGWVVAYDHRARIEQLRQFLTAPAANGASPELAALLPILADTFGGFYEEARKALDALTDVPDPDRAQFRTIVTRTLLADRSMEWTVHGPQRCFRFWSDTEKVRYITSAVEISDALATLTPNVCFGFGAALSVVRDGALIPHDDDLDIIIAFDPHEARNLNEGLARVEQHLRPLGFTVTGNFSAHRHVRRPGAKHVDVFVGLFEGDVVSWYPGARGALTRDMMFPTSSAPLMGVTCPLPRNPLVYLEKLYGAGWRHPDPNFRHTWDRSAYADLAGRKPATTGS
ncbi:hypothetical protein SAMN04489867_0611 [Pedococcus dokdonensis]|uniref:LicD family protein n=1 Tax=Pedococcus dokdonensis TaxID=443156 RepID=A0A1H0MH21_9MICO|nr:hypothetical protein [Pedococcus dokdonensis]SDO79743.1 hypothetical protein SAMN04489867_0611 [Pedococcus dokdonensis]